MPQPPPIPVSEFTQERSARLERMLDELDDHIADISSNPVEMTSELIAEPATRPLPRVAAAFFGSPWCIESGKFYALCDLVERRAELGLLMAFDAPPRVGLEMSALGPSPRNGRSAGGKVALIRIHGVMANRVGSVENASSRSVTSEMVQMQLRTVAGDPAFGSIILDIDSPGGTVAGIPELADLVWQIGQSGKKVVAVAASTAASAAYWVGSQATEFYAAPSGNVGSIGVMMMHVDQSEELARKGIKRTLISAGKFKGEGVMELSDEAMAYAQRMVDRTYDSFVSAVARGRHVDKRVVISDFGQGRVVTAEDAVGMGMIDGVATLAQVIESELEGLSGSSGGSAIAQSDGFAAHLSGPVAEDEDEMSELRARFARMAVRAL